MLFRSVDLTLIRWMLSLTPAERPPTLQQYVDSVVSVRARNSETRLPAILRTLTLHRVDSSLVEARL